jgi:hypothetical protein
MKKISGFLLVFATTMGALSAAGASFWQQLTSEERRAAGVDQLTPEQQAALDQLAGRFAREGARQVREAAKTEVSEQVKAEVREQVKAEAREEAKAEVREEVKRELKAEQKAHEEAKSGLPVDEKNTIIHSRIVGKFHGWSGGTVFHLENGQTWVQMNSSDSLWVPTMENPDVEIRPAGFGGWKLFLGEKGFWLHVRRVK